MRELGRSCSRLIVGIANCSSYVIHSKIPCWFAVDGRLKARFEGSNVYIVPFFGPPEGAPILFLLSPEVSRTSGTMSIYIYMSTTWRTRSRYKIFRLYFGEIHSFAPDHDFISEGSFRPEEFFEILF